MLVLVRKIQVAVVVVAVPPQRRVPLAALHTWVVLVAVLHRVPVPVTLVQVAVVSLVVRPVVAVAQTARLVLVLALAARLTTVAQPAVAAAELTLARGFISPQPVAHLKA